jgi:hypothetical protein
VVFFTIQKSENIIWRFLIRIVKIYNYDTNNDDDDDDDDNSNNNNDNIIIIIK